ncbi:MAG: DUF4384 domain-containing protein [Spirochaetota bacterium]|nr:DUF4384 domain-containing protein [Spirochaetota bacterium]
MKHLKCIFVFLLFFTNASAQYSAVRIGVMPFVDSDKKNATSGRSEDATAQVTNALYKYKFIKLVDRSKMKEMMREIELGMSGIVDESTAVKVGKMHGLQMMVVGTIRKNRITARAVHMETQKVISSDSVADISGIELLGYKLASGIEVFLARENLKKLRNDSPDINLDFWVEKGSASRGLKITPSAAGRIKIGEKVVFKFKSNRDGYLTIVDIQPCGDVVVLFPNDIHSSNRIESGREYSIPSEEDGFEITVSEPAGLDTIVAFFTKERVDWLDRKKLIGEGFWTVKEKEKFSMSRGFKITATKLKHADWESRAIEIDVYK